MDRRQITPDYSVSVQLLPEDFSALAAAGVATVINNRPDNEVPPELGTARMREAAEAAGLNFIDAPIVPSALAADVAAAQADAIASANGAVHAYCRSGTRSAFAWALAQAGALDPETILGATANAGYPLDGMRPTIEQLAAAKG